MGWEFRVIKKTNRPDYLDNPITVYGIHQVFLDENNDVVHIEESSIFFEENIAGLKTSLKKMLDCCEQPVIDYINGEDADGV
jgi:hypothetical protein